jgi:hypothetical protein
MPTVKKPKQARFCVDYTTAKTGIKCFGCPTVIKQYEKYFQGLQPLCPTCAEGVFHGRKPKEEAKDAE